MKKINYFIFILLLLLPIANIKALEVSSNNVKIEKGNTKNVELYANVNEEIKSVTFTLTFSTYDMPAYYSPAEGVYDATPNSITHTVTFNENKSGKVYLGNVVISIKLYPTDTYGNVAINTAKAITINNEEITLTPQNINISIGVEPPKEEKKDPNLLDKIESKLVKIELKKDVFEYEVKVKDSITELDLKAIAKEDSTNIEISSQKLDKEKDNVITITAKNGSTEQKYLIKVKLEKEEKKVVIAESNELENTNNNNYKVKWIILSIIMAFILVTGLILNKKK